MAVKDLGNSWSGSVKSTVGLNSSNSSIPGRVVSTKTISGTVGKIVEPVYYIGLTTDTAATETDKRNRTIKVDVLKTPETLTIINKEDNPNGETVDFNGSVAKQLVLRNYTIGKIADNEFALLKDGIKTGESIIIPDGEKIDTVTLVFVSDVPYLKFTFSNSDREPLFCSLEDLGIAEIKADIARIKADLVLLNASIEAVSTSLDNHIADKNNPHEVTKSQVGLGNVVNTGDSATPVEDGVTKFTTGGAYTLKTTLEGAIQSEAQARSDEDGRLAGLINTLDGKVVNIEQLIPSQASAQNQLADKEFVNSSIATNTANFLGTYNVVTDLGLTRSATHAQVANALELKMIELGITPTNNDYCFIIIPDAEIVTQVEQFDRYKYTVAQESGLVDEWRYEYTLNNSSFTSAQWAAINSGITSAKVSSYDAHILDKNNPHEVTKAQVGLGNVDNTSDLNKPVSTATRALVEEHDIHFIGEFESYDDLEAESATINDFATITIQSGNDLDYEIWLYTAEGWEYTYGFTIAGIYAIADFDVLPEVTQHNKDIFARIDGKDIYSAEYKEAVPTVISMPPVVSASSSSPIDNISSYFTDYDNLAISNENIDNCYVNRYNIPDNLFQAIRLGTKNNLGECTFQLNSFPAIEETDTVYLELSNYFSYVQNTGAITGATETTAYIQIDSGSILYVDDLELNYIDATTQPPLTDIDITAQVKNLLDDDEEIFINIGKTDGANRFFFCGFKIVGEDGTVKRWLKIAHTDYVDEKIDEVNTAISDLDNRLSQDEEDITTLQSDLEDTNEEVHWIKTEMGTVQIFDRDELPVANDSYLNKILRVDHKLYQCIKTGDEDAFVKHYSFEDMTGSSEIFKYNWADAARIVTNNFDDYFTATWEDNEPMSSYDVQVGEIYKYSLNNTENTGILLEDKGNITLLSGLDNFIFTGDDTSVPYPLYNINYVESSTGQGDLVSVTITISGTSSSYDRIDAVDILQHDGHLEYEDATEYIQQVIDGGTAIITWTEDLDNIDFDNIVHNLNSDGFISSLDRQYTTIQNIHVDDTDDTTYEYTNNYTEAGNFWITYLVNEVPQDWDGETELNVYHIKYPWDSNKIFREPGALKFGNSSGDTGNVKLYRIDESELPITRVDLDVKAWSATKDSCIILGIYDEAQGSNTFDAEILPASEDLYHLVYNFKNNTEAIEPLVNDGKSWINISTEKGQKTSYQDAMIDTVLVSGTRNYTDSSTNNFTDLRFYRCQILDNILTNIIAEAGTTFRAYCNTIEPTTWTTEEQAQEYIDNSYCWLFGIDTRDESNLVSIIVNDPNIASISNLSFTYSDQVHSICNAIKLSDDSIWNLSSYDGDYRFKKDNLEIQYFEGGREPEVGVVVPSAHDTVSDEDVELNLTVTEIFYPQEPIITYTDTRVHLLAIDVYYGNLGYEWSEVSGGANVEIVEELPEVGEENTIYLIKNSTPGPTPGSTVPLIEVTYDELVSLRDNSELIPGMQYRITDYVTTSAQINTKSALHKFDVIVTADGTNTLNENARACVSADDTGYFCKIGQKVISASWISPMPSISDIQILYTLTENESMYGEAHESAQVITELTTREDQYGVLVPAMLNPDPDEEGNECYYTYCGTYSVSSYQNNLVSIQYVINDQDEVAYTGDEWKPEDIFVEIGYTTGTGSAPVMYKNDIAGKYGEEGPDHEEPFVYVGDFVLDGVTYNRWRKYESVDYYPFDKDPVYVSETGYEILTQVIVENNQFIITQEELDAAIEVVTTVYDKWQEYYTDSSTTFTPGPTEDWHLTNHLVDAEMDDTITEYKNLASWKLKYSLDNDTSRFAWALDGQAITNLNSRYSNGNILTRHPNYDGDHTYDGVTYHYAWGTSEDEGDGDDEAFFYSQNETLSNNETVYKPGTGTAQAEVISGKGVIYWMRDEWNNEAPYDFKNIIYSNEGHLDFTFSNDISLDEGDITNKNFPYCINMKIGEYYSNDKLTLPNNRFHISKDYRESSTWYYNCIIMPGSYNNKIFGECNNISMAPNCYNNTVSNEITDVIVNNITFDSGCYNNTLINTVTGLSLYNINIKQDCYGMTINNSHNINLGIQCYNTTITMSNNIEIGNHNQGGYLNNSSNIKISNDTYDINLQNCNNTIIGDTCHAIYLQESTSDIIINGSFGIYLEYSYKNIFDTCSNINIRYQGGRYLNTSSFKNCDSITSYTDHIESCVFINCNSLILNSSVPYAQSQLPIQNYNLYNISNNSNVTLDRGNTFITNCYSVSPQTVII